MSAIFEADSDYEFGMLTDTWAVNMCLGGWTIELRPS